jgi:hypothetical protein
MAKRVFPTREQTTFIVADDVRVEQSNKILVIGFYAGNRIVVFNTPTAEHPVRLRLVFLLAFRDGFGDFQANLAITAPGGTVLFKHDFVEAIAKDPESSMTMAAGGLLEIKQLGEYAVTVSLSERDYQFGFTIQRAKGGAPRRKAKRSARAVKGAGP